MEKKFKANDLVWAKPSNIPNWPAIILDDPVDSTIGERTDEHHYWCFLFGRQEYMWLKEPNIEPYEDFCKMYKKCCKGGVFERAVRAIEEIIFNIKYIPGYKIDLSHYKSFDDVDSQPNGDRPTNGFHNGRPENDSPEHTPKKHLQPTEKSNGPSTSKRKTRAPSKRVAIVPAKQLERRLSSDAILAKPSAKQHCIKTKRHHGPPVTADSEPPQKVIRIESNKRIGFIGVGVIGEHFVRKMIAAGCKLHLWNRTRIKCENLLLSLTKSSEQLVLVFDSPRKVAENSDIIFSCLNDDSAVRFALFDTKCGIMPKEDRVFGSLVKGKIYVEMSTITVQLSKQIEQTIHDFGGEYVEMQFQGSRKEIEGRKLLTYYAGDQNATITCSPYFHLITDRSEARYVGSVGKALELQAFLQLIRAVLLAGVSEGLALAAKCDISKQDVLSIIKETKFSSPYLIDNIERMINLDFNENIQQRVELMNKDIRLALDIGNTVKEDLMMTCAAKEIYKSVRHMGFEGKDVSCVSIDCNNTWGMGPSY